MKKYLWMFLVFVVIIPFSGCWNDDVDDGLPGGNSVLALVSESNNSIRLSSKFQNPGLELVDTKGGSFISVSIDGFDKYGAIGAPALPAIRKMVLLPVGAEIEIIATAKQIEIIEIDELVIPNQPPVEKIPGAYKRAQFVFNDNAYEVDQNIVGGLARITEEAMMRNHRVALLEVTPVDYNPSRGELTFAKEIEIEIKFNNPDFKQTFELSDRFGNSYFDSILSRYVINKGSKWSRWTAPAPGADYLIIYANSFSGSPALNALKALKQGEGWSVHTESVSNAGATMLEIRDYIVDQYNTLPDLTFVLLVGDTNTITHGVGFGSSSPATDLYYSCITPDYIPDLLLGRLPARTEEQLANMVSKIQAYQSGSGQWLSEAAFMASVDRYNVSEGTHNAVIDYFLAPNNYTSYKLYSHTYSATTAQVGAALNNGVNYAIYSGHGGVTEWADGPPFSQGNVQGLTNTDYPFVCSFSCLTGRYQTDECFAETWVRDPHGASAMLASSVTSYWDEDDWYEKGMFLGLFAMPFAAFPDQTWIASASMCGKFAVWVKSNQGGDSQRYFEMYNLFGDPSMELFTY